MSYQIHFNEQCAYYIFFDFWVNRSDPQKKHNISKLGVCFCSFFFVVEINILYLKKHTKP